MTTQQVAAKVLQYGAAELKSIYHKNLTIGLSFGVGLVMTIIGTNYGIIKLNEDDEKSIPVIFPCAPRCFRVRAW